MKRLAKLAVALVIPVIFAMAAAAAEPAAELPPLQRPPIYDRAADGEQQLAAALARATTGNKRVLAMFGANWCVWCHRLHGLMRSDQGVAAELARDYEVVMIDVDKLPDGTKHNAALNERLGDPMAQGLPVLVVFDEAGKPLVTQETGALEDGKAHDPAKVRAFLEKWARPRAEAK